MSDIGWGDEFEVYVDEVKAETDRALLCMIDGDEVWLPRSQIHRGGDVDDSSAVGSSGSIILTAWIAREKGWL